MTFLIDENLSRKLKAVLEPVFPGCRHVADFDLLRAEDSVIHARAKAEGLALLSKDDDFRALVDAAGPPPKLVFVRLGNVSTAQIASALIAKAEVVNAHLAEPEQGVFTVFSEIGA